MSDSDVITNKGLVDFVLGHNGVSITDLTAEVKDLELELAAERNRVCEWVWDEGYSMLNSQCGEPFSKGMYLGMVDRRLNRCPNCGGKIKEVGDE